jgi:endonuclease/exonuclease/phosphatase family metal-dependent hydrolase
MQRNDGAVSNDGAVVLREFAPQDPSWRHKGTVDNLYWSLSLQGNTRRNLFMLSSRASMLSLTFAASFFLDAIHADEKPGRLVIATWNVEWFFDEYTGDNYSKLAKQLSAPSRDEWDWRLAGVAEAIAEMQPDILALQEVENQRVLWYLVQRLEKEHSLTYRIAFVQGRDFYTEQDVAILYRSGLVEFGRRIQSQEMFGDHQYHQIRKHIFATFEWGQGDEKEKLRLVNVHLRAMPEQADIRRRQARLLKAWLNEAIARGDNVILLGDMNVNQKYSEATPETPAGILRGMHTATEDDDLVDLHGRLKEDDRHTHLIFKQFDRILVSKPLTTDMEGKIDLVLKSIRIPREVCVRGEKQDEDHWNIFYDIDQDERDLSDHYPVVAEFEFK